MRYFISQPMRGRTDAEIMAERNMVIAAMQRANPEAEYIDSVLENAPDGCKTALWCLGESIKLLSTADMCIFVGAWRYARGCCIENIACHDYGVICYEFNAERGVLVSVGGVKMRRKRFVKILMSHGIERNFAVYLAGVFRRSGYSYQEAADMQRRVIQWLIFPSLNTWASRRFWPSWRRRPANWPRQR